MKPSLALIFSAMTLAFAHAQAEPADGFTRRPILISSVNDAVVTIKDLGASIRYEACFVPSSQRLRRDQLDTFLRLVGDDFCRPLNATAFPKGDTAVLEELDKTFTARIRGKIQNKQQVKAVLGAISAASHSLVGVGLSYMAWSNPGLTSRVAGGMLGAAVIVFGLIEARNAYQIAQSDAPLTFELALQRFHQQVPRDLPNQPESIALPLGNTLWGDVMDALREATEEVYMRHYST